MNQVINRSVMYISGIYPCSDSWNQTTQVLMWLDWEIITHQCPIHLNIQSLQAVNYQNHQPHNEPKGTWYRRSGPIYVSICHETLLIRSGITDACSRLYSSNILPQCDWVKLFWGCQYLNHLHLLFNIIPIVTDVPQYTLLTHIQLVCGSQMDNVLLEINLENVSSLFMYQTFKRMIAHSYNKCINRFDSCCHILTWMLYVINWLIFCTLIWILSTCDTSYHYAHSFIIWCATPW